MNETNASHALDIGLGLAGTHVLVTGGCGLIGRVVVQAFLAAGCNVTVYDLPNTNTRILDSENQNPFFVSGDITKPGNIDYAFLSGEAHFSQTVECVIALASLDLSVLPQTESICDADPAVWQRVFDVNIRGTFLTCQRWLQGIRAAASNPASRSKLRNVSCVLMGSESGRFGSRTMPAYAAGKAAIQYGLLRSLAADAPRIYHRARVNAVAPGAVDTERFREESERFGEQWRYAECEATVPRAQPVPAEDVARTCLFLASERFAGSVHGCLVPVDKGKMGTLVYGREELGRMRMEGWED